jgi:hypothetical protein
VWQDAYGLNGDADADGDGDTDGRDFLVWQRQIGQSSHLMSTSYAIPEPNSTAIVVLLGFAGFFRYGRTAR